MKVYGYLRVSGRGQLSGDGFTRQELAIRKYCKAEGHELVHIYKERGVTGTADMDDRPAWRDMMAAILANGVRSIVVERLDRLARDLMVQEHIIVDCQKRSVTLLSTEEPDLCSTEPTRILMRQILGAIAAYDKSMIVLKLRGARERKRDATGRCEGAKRYGELEGEAAVLERMRAIEATGAPLSAIADALNNEGLRPRRGEQWFPMSVSRILARGRGMARL